jgi:hypothetical protein
LIHGAGLEENIDTNAGKNNHKWNKYQDIRRELFWGWNNWGRITFGR